MKKMTFVACTAMLASVVAFTGCNSDKNEPGRNMGSVKTEFSITLPSQVRGSQNRMPAYTAQEDGLAHFQGITGIYLVPFAETTITGSVNRLGANIHLDEDVTSADAGRPSAAKVYSNVDVPLTTSAFLFYGKSAKSGEKAETGSLTANFGDLLATPSAFSFALDPIKDNFASSVLGSGEKGDLLKQYLTSIASAKDETNTQWYAYSANGGLQSMFTEFSRIHGLSSFEIARVLTDLNQSLQPLVASNTMAASIRAAIEAGSAYVAVDGVTHEVTMKSPYDNFPQEYGLPAGCIDIAWNDSEKAFKDGAYSNMANPATFVYPAQLWYFVNSAIKTSNTSKKTLYDNEATHTWDYILAQHTDGTSVDTRTRAVAIKDSIQYAVARLDVAVKLDNNSLADNSETAVGKATAVNCASGFNVCGILVGGQKNVGWDFTPITSTEYTIYDKEMTNPAMKAVSTGFSVVNHTLVLENGTADVMVAVELENPSTGVDFYGADNMLIAKGSKFYVVGKLEAASATKTGGHVFKQDYVTKANLTLKDLKHAYNTLPDLRTPQLEIGFSVNLSWKDGHTYDIDFE